MLVTLTGEVHQYGHKAEAQNNGNGDVDTLLSPGPLLVRGDVLAGAFRWSFRLDLLQVG